MQISDYRKKVKETFKIIDDLCQKKGKDYSKAGDTLLNFKNTAKILNVFGWQVNGTEVKASDVTTFFELIKLLRKVNLRGRTAQNESVKDTIEDQVNYILLGAACLEDEQ